jgi:hypothetical protein
LPGWIQEAGGKLRLIPERATAVRRIFQLAASGHGVPSIVKTLIAEGVPPFGKHVIRENRIRSAYSGKWTRAYVQLILSDKRALGELQMYQGTDKDGKPIPDGPPVAGYYPAAITEADWLAARAGIRGRRRHQGRVSEKQVNIFAGILKHAKDGDSYVMTQRISQSRSARAKGQPGRKFQILVNSLGDSGQARAYSLPYDVMEQAMLKSLNEIDPHDILNGDGPHDETTALREEVEGVEAELEECERFMADNGFSPAIGKRIKQLEGHKAGLAAQLLEAQEKARYPLSECWGETKGLIKILDASENPRATRLRLRTALRQIVEGVFLLIIRRGRSRLAAVQMWFAGGKRHRDYLVFYRPPRANAGGQWWVRSLASVAAPGDLDLRRQADVAQLAKALLAVDLEGQEP